MQSIPKVHPSGASEPELQLLAGSVGIQGPNTPQPSSGLMATLL